MIRALTFGVLVLLSMHTGWGDEKQDTHAEHHSTAAENPTMATLTKLVGTWVAADDKNQPTDQVVSVIKLTAGGSVLHETLFPGQDQEMVSIYTVDGEDVVMTHYCMLGNQPRMKASGQSTDNTIKWAFAGGSNLDPAKDKHMHGATLTILDPDHIKIEGVAWDNGKPAEEMCGTMNLVRQK
ncbi:hypothetical protein FYK55_15045 [Roseiconus nitratireducens]|uniref:DUF1579 domain-containing protein n=1 Tax=Roseiconus nitratireducens TaxID=2605748 RepID=A0A5M6D460_9BACT|nr:hypothetical protein [Roseiconus nitratireducens]KAA5542123.1 hypothetical protein FYK55_15045 [Roseiconus nitratireducens]